MIFEKLSSQILRTIGLWIVSGELADDGRLPSIKQLVDILGVSAVTVREAVIALETLGIVTIKHGKGIYVVSPDHILEDFFQARVELETLMARKAAVLGTPEMVESMHHHVEKMEEAAGKQDNELYGLHDAPFHSRMFEISGLFILGNLVNLLKSAIFMPEYYMLDELRKDPSYLIESNKGHWAIYESMVSHDPEAAEKAIGGHLARIYTVWHRNMDSIKARVKSELSQMQIII